MIDWELLRELIDQAMREITMKMTGIQLIRVEANSLREEETESPQVAIEITSESGFALVYSAEDRLLRAIAERMKRRPVVNVIEAAEYAKEYVNVVFGHAISAFNRRNKTSIRFGVPCCRLRGSTGSHQLYQLYLVYQSREGSAKMHVPLHC